MRQMMIRAALVATALGGSRAGAQAAAPAARAYGADGGPTGAFTYSTQPAVAAVQRQAKAFVEAYEQNLNASNVPAILAQFAPDAVSEWNDKATVTSRDSLTTPYRTIFATTKFSTDFQFDAVDVYGDDVAVVRTHHPVGQTELNTKDGAKTPDFNREIFMLRKTGGVWHIVLYTFNTEPQQGVQ